MTIGLTVKQIRKLSRGSYTEKQLVSKAGHRGIGVSGSCWWENGFIVLFEAPPDGAKVKSRTATETLDCARQLGQWLARCNREVYPVELTGHEDVRVLHFANASGDRVTVDSRYIATMLTTKRAGKQAESVRWYTDSQGDFIMGENGHKIGLVFPLKVDNDPDWNFRYTGELPKGG